MIEFTRRFVNGISEDESSKNPPNFNKLLYAKIDDGETKEVHRPLPHIWGGDLASGKVKED